MSPLRASPALYLGLLALLCAGSLYWLSVASAVVGAGEEVFPQQHDPDVEPLPRPQEVRDAADLRPSRLQIEQLAQLLPPRPALPEVFLGHPEQGGIRGRFVAGALSSGFSRSRGGPQLLRFELDPGRAQYRELRLPAEGRLVLDRSAEEVCSGRVLAADGKPLAGASIWLAGVRGCSDEAGRFELAAQPVAGGLPLVIAHPDHASHYRVLSVQAYRGLAQRPIQLQPGCRLRLRVMSDPVHLAAATPLLLPAERRELAMLAYPFFMQAVEPLRLDAEGIVEIRGLPATGSLRVAVVGPGLLMDHIQTVELRRGSQQVVLRPRTRALLELVVQDLDGRPQAEVLASLRPAGSRVTLQHAGWLLPPPAYFPQLSQARSDGRGRLVLTRPDAGDQVLSLESGQVGLLYSLAASAQPGVLSLPRQQPEWGQPALRLLAGAGPDRRLEVLQDGNSWSYRWDSGQPLTLPLRHRGLYRLSWQDGDQGEEEELLQLVAGPGRLRLGGS